MAAQPKININELFQTAVRKYKFDPCSFAKDIFGVELDVCQQEIADIVADVPRKIYGVPTKYNHLGLNKISVRSMHGPGKTFLAALLMHWWNFCFAGVIPCTAPKIDQLKRRLWPAFRLLRRKAPNWYQNMVKVDSMMVTWGGDPDWMAVAETAANAEALAGYHHDFLLFVVDEAAGVPEEMWPVILGALSTGKCVVVFIIGNPTKNTGFFYNTQYKESFTKDWYPYHISLDKTTRVSKAHVDSMINMYGKESPVVQVRVFGNAPDTDENQLIPLAWLEEARYRSFYNDGSLPRWRVSVDVADGGLDSSIITVGQHYTNFKHILKQLEFNFPPSKSPILLAKEVVKLWDRYDMGAANGDDVVVDALGVGAGCAGTLMEDFPEIPMIPYKGGSKSDNPEVWLNRRSQTYCSMRDDFRLSRVIMDEHMTDDWDSFDAQMCAVRTRPGLERVEELEPKKDLKKRTGWSPDKADSMAMQWAKISAVIGDIIPIGVGQSEFANYDAGLT